MKNKLIKLPKGVTPLYKASACGGITIGAAYDCENPIVAGVNQRLILIPKEMYDRATITYDATLTSLITDIVLADSGDVALAFQGVRRSLNPQTAFVPATVTIGYDHQVTFQIFEVDQAQKDNIEKLGAGNVVAIIQNINAVGNGDSVFEVFGKDAGLEMQAGAMRINADTETNGSYTIDLKTSEESGKEPKLPTSWFDTDYLTTVEKVNALLIPVV